MFESGWDRPAAHDPTPLSDGSEFAGPSAAHLVVPDEPTVPRTLLTRRKSIR